MRRHGIRSRDDLAEALGQLGIGRTTVYRTFDASWSGKVSLTVLGAMVRVFKTPLARLVADPLEGKEKTHGVK